MRPETSMRHSRRVSERHRMLSEIHRSRRRLMKQDKERRKQKMTGKVNICPLCGYDAFSSRHRYKSGETFYDVFKCESQHCGAEFIETGTGPELVPAEFEEGETYTARLWNGRSKIRVELSVEEKKGAFLNAKVNGMFTHEFELSVINGVEVLLVGPDFVGRPGKIYPYNVKFDTEETR